VKRGSIVWVALCGAVSCAYYNAMWRAEHFATEARRAEARGSALEARSWWARAAEKAESVVAQHPTSRWAEPALVLQGEGLARSGACERAAAPLALALRKASTEALRERAALAAAECALDANDPTAADRHLGGVTTSRDARRRSRAELLAGRAAQLAGDYASAAEWYRRSAEPAAGPARARALVGAGRTAEAIALVDTLAHGQFSEGDWAAVFDAVARTAGPGVASETLDRMLAGRRLPAGARARLLLADGDRLLAAGEAEAAGVRYAQVAGVVPDSTEGHRARVRQSRAAAARAESLEDLVAIRADLTRLALGGGASAAAAEARSLEFLLRLVLDPEDHEEGTVFRTAETVRDSLGAARVAGRLLIAFAADRPASIFAPKAVVAAATLLPEARDSLIAVLAARYPASPYTLALRGDPSPGFAAAEDSLARALGVETAASMEPGFLSRVAPPVPGPRGPQLDPPASAATRTPSREPPRPGAGERDDAPGRRPPPSSSPSPGQLRDTS